MDLRTLLAGVCCGPYLLLYDRIALKRFYYWFNRIFHSGYRRIEGFVRDCRTSDVLTPSARHTAASTSTATALRHRPPSQHLDSPLKMD